jgi:hypothetical protein
MFNHLTRDLMADNTRASKWKFTFYYMKVRVANPTGLGLDKNFTSLGARHAELFNGERLIRFPEYNSTHVRRSTTNVIR